MGALFKGRVKDLASDGRGVVTHPSGRTFFVSGVWPGEEGEFRITGLKGRIGFAQLHRIELGGEHSARVQPQCSHHGFYRENCGGCPWQFMAYEQQLAAKQQRVEQAIARLKTKAVVKPILPSPKQWAYRNRAQFKSDGRVVGYVAPASNSLVAIEQCPVLSEKNQRTLSAMIEALPKASWRPGKKQHWTTLDIDESVDVTGVSVNQRLPFQQANSDQNVQMQTWLTECLSELKEPGNVLELFCGSGNLTETIVQSIDSRVVAVEAIETALKRLREKALPRVEAVACDLFSERDTEKLLPTICSSEILVLDPPREGLKVKAPFFVKKSRLKHIFYLSCDLATFSRDVSEFMAQGYHLKEVQPLDMFPHTAHIEIMGYLQRK